MKWIFGCAMVVALIAGPAGAMEITNLSDAPAKFLFESVGTKQVYTAQPDETVRIVGQTNGFLSVIQPDGTIKKDNGNLHADGILSGIIGSARSARIPAESWDAFVLWPDGTFGVQQRRRGGKLGR